MVDYSVRDIIVALDTVAQELNKLKKPHKEEFHKIIGSGSQEGGFIGTLLASIGIPMIIKALSGQGLHSTTQI